LGILHSWVVVDQDPAAGETVDAGTVIKLGAVQYGDE
jgi:hypothetical protein